MPIENVSTRDVPNVPKEQPDSVSGMEVVDVVPFQTVTKEQETNSFVRLMEAASAVMRLGARNLPLGAHIYVRAMVEDADVQSTAAKNLPSLQQSFASNTAVEKNAVILAARR